MGDCPCVPIFAEKCIFDGKHKQLLCCNIHNLTRCAIQLKKTIPIIGPEIEEYICPDYEPEEKN